MELIEVWKDVPPERAKLGITLWLTGGEFYLGRRLYRWRYTWNS